MKIIISGGHLTPALALIDYIHEQHTADEIIFVGREYAQQKNKQLSKERLETEKRSVTFIPFITGKIDELSLTSLVVGIMQFIKGFFHALNIMAYQKPSVFISFGSYVAVPLALAAWIFRVPIITHEQTRTVGSANRFIAYFAKVVAVSYSQTSKLLPQNKVIFTGNLLRKQLIQKAPPKPDWISGNLEKPILYITGGSQGSEVINTVIGQSLPRILKDWFVIHQCGGTSATRNYRRELEAVRDQLKPQLRFSYVVKEWISVDELAWIYKNATALISRAGANTTQEIALFGLASILIPLPFSHHNEQLLNAQWLESTGGAILIQQKDFTTDALQISLDVLKNRHKACRRKLAELVIPMDADLEMYELAKKYAR